MHLTVLSCIGQLGYAHHALLAENVRYFELVVPEVLVTIDRETEAHCDRHNALTSCMCPGKRIQDR